MSEERELFSVDVLPPRCSIEAQFTMRKDDLPQTQLTVGEQDAKVLVGDSPHGWIRFRAVRGKRFRRKQRSDWSGWFPMASEPVALRWETFWEPV